MRSEKDLNATVAAWDAELNKERAGALGMTARRLEDLLALCAELARQLERATDADVRALLLSDYRSAWAESEQQRWNLCVQREAIGLYRHDDVDRHYPPAPKR